MSNLNQTPRSDRIHIALFGRRNVGKSSVINALTKQEISIVSDVKGTTTDPVYKAMEILPLGPVVIIDTPGLDDEGALGELRVQRTYDVLNKTDCAILVADVNQTPGKWEEEAIHRIREKKIPMVCVMNKSDLSENKSQAVAEFERRLGVTFQFVSAQSGTGMEKLKETLISTIPQAEHQRPIVSDRIEPGDVVILVIPIDEAAPKGRVILPQQQTLRDILDRGAIAMACQDTELKQTLASLKTKPKLVVTDSQAFEQVARDTPDDVLLTSFSILVARYKGEVNRLMEGVEALRSLKEGDRILIAEGCTHHRQCNDIGTVKIPKMLREYTGKNFEFEFSSGTRFPQDLQEFALIIHCGACMLNPREMQWRMSKAEEAGVPMVNYGIFIAQVKGILERSMEIFRS